MKKQGSEILLNDFIEGVRTGIIYGRDFTPDIELLRSENDKIVKSRIKRKLPVIMVSGCSVDRKNIENYNQIIQIDIDGIGAEKAGILKKKVGSDPFAILGAISPSGSGVKVLYQVDSEKDRHQEVANMVYDHFEKTYFTKVDRSVRGVTGLMYATYDPECNYNPDAQIFNVPPRKPLVSQGLSSSYVTSMVNKRGLEMALKRGHKDHGEYKEGNRSNFLHLVASMCNNSGVDREYCERYLKSNFEFDGDRMQSAIDSAYKREEQFGVYRLPSSISELKSEVGEHPFSNTPFIPEEFFNTLPTSIQKVLGLYDDGRERDLFALSLIVVYSAALGDSFFEYGNNKLHANLMGIMLAPAASGKGAMTPASKIAETLDQQLVKKGAAKMEMYKKAYAKCKMNPECAEDAMIKPKIESFTLAGNASAAGFVEDLENNKGRGLIIETEGDTLSSSTDQQWGDYTYMTRCAFHHEPIKVSRVGRKINIASPQLSTCITGTPDQVHRLVKSVENGMFSRNFFYAFHKKPKWRSQLKSSKSGLRKEVETLSEDFLGFYAFMKKHPFELKWTDAQSKRHDDKFEEMLNSSSHVDHAQASLIRLGIIVVRVALITTAMNRYQTSDKSEVVTCTDEIFNAALSLGDVFLEHMIRVLALVKNEKVKPLEVKTIDSFYDCLPDEFETKDAITLMKDSFGQKERTTERYLSELCRIKRLFRTKKGCYSKNEFQ